MEFLATTSGSGGANTGGAGATTGAGGANTSGNVTSSTCKPQSNQKKKISISLNIPIISLKQLHRSQPQQVPPAQQVLHQLPVQHHLRLTTAVITLFCFISTGQFDTGRFIPKLLRHFQFI